MKTLKLLAVSLPIFLFPFFAFAYNTCEVTPNGGASYSFTVPSGTTHTWILYQNGRSVDWGGENIDMFAYKSNATLLGSIDLDNLTGWNSYEFVKADGTYHLIVFDSNDWNLWNYATAIADHSGIITSTCDFIYPQEAVPESPSGDSSFSAMIGKSQGEFASTTGTSMGGAVMWAGSTFIGLFLGSGLAILWELRLWIVAMIVISALVYFAFRAFRFTKH